MLTRVVRYVLPVPARLGEGFGAVGSHWASRHTGQDFVVPYGTPVHAVGSGRVVRAGWAGPYGNRIELMLPDGTELWFCHLSRFAVRSGPVTVGQVIGYVGATGNATGPHLHFEVHPPAGSALAATSPSWAYPVDEPGVGRAVNPIPWLRARGLL